MGLFSESSELIKVHGTLQQKSVLIKRPFPKNDSISHLTTTFNNKITDTSDLTGNQA